MYPKVSDGESSPLINTPTWQEEKLIKKSDQSSVKKSVTASSSEAVVQNKRAICPIPTATSRSTLRSSSPIFGYISK
jgi:hypothetical protein